MTTLPPLPRSLLAAAFLAAVVIGSGIAAQRLSPKDIGLELFENAAATDAGLFTIILMFGPVSGGHFNPIVSFVDARFGGITRRDAVAYLPAQVSGCVLAIRAIRALYPDITPAEAADVLLPDSDTDHASVDRPASLAGDGAPR